MMPILFQLLFFLQLQWLSIIAGMLWGRLSGKLDRLAALQWLGITALLTAEACGTGYLISKMYCGEVANAVIQGVGSVCLCVLGGFISCRFLPNLTTGRFTIIAISGGLLLYLWQFILLARYYSLEWLMLFLLPTISLFLLASVTKLVTIFIEIKAATPNPRRQHFLSLILMGTGYLVFTIIATFAAAIAFDCGI